MAPGSRIVVNNGGSIRALGTESCPVRIVSAKSTPAAGDWSRIEIEESASNDSLFRYTEIRHGDPAFETPTADGFLWVKSRSSVGLSHVRFAQIRGPVLKVEDGGRFSTFEAVNFDDVGSDVAVVAADVVASMTRVTVTNTVNPRIVIDYWARVAHGPATWRNLGVPLVLPAGFEVRSGPIEIAAGSVLRFEANSRSIVKANGSIRALGTATEPVIFESAKPAPAPGDWLGITFETSSSADNLLRHVIIRHAGDNDSGVLHINDRATLTVENITMEMNSSCEVKVDGMGVLNESGGRMLTRCM
jgi:hypothetical protein